RPVSSAHDDHTALPYATDLRCRLHRACRLRPTRAGAARLQPNQTRAPLLPPAALFRGPEQRVLARGVAAGRCSYCQWSLEPAYRLLGEGSQWSPVGRRARRQRILRSRADRMAGGAAGQLRHRCPPDRSDQTQVDAPALCESQPRSRGGRVSLPAHLVAPRLPLRRHPTGAARGACRATDAVQVGQISLPGPGHHMLLQPLNLWRFYNDRAGIELLIKQLKGDYALGSIPTRHFFANETYFHLLLLAYNLVNWFKRLCLPDHLQNAT